MKKLFLSIGLFSIIILASGQSKARVYYTSPTGNAVNPAASEGSRGNPMDLVTALTTATSTDTVHLFRGVYDITQPILLEHSILIKGEDREDVILNIDCLTGGRSTCFEISLTDNYALQFNNLSIVLTNGTQAFALNSGRLFLNSINVRNGNGGNQYFFGASNNLSDASFSIANSVFDDISINPLSNLFIKEIKNSRFMGSYTDDALIYHSTSDQNKFKRFFGGITKIENNTFENTSLTLYGLNAPLLANVSTNTFIGEKSHISASAVSYETSVNFYKNTFDNYLSGISINSVDTGACIKGIVEGNIFQNQIVDPVATAASAISSQNYLPSCQDKIVISNNLIEASHQGYGIKISSDSMKQFDIIHNTIINGNGHPLFITNSVSLDIFNNIFIRDNVTNPVTTFSISIYNIAQTHINHGSNNFYGYHYDISETLQSMGYPAIFTDLGNNSYILPSFVAGTYDLAQPMPGNINHTTTRDIEGILRTAEPDMGAFEFELQ
jgi:hypothetical protein